EPCGSAGVSGISSGFPGLSQSLGQVAHVLRTRSPLIPGPKPRSPFDLHVLGAPPAFVLSQDQTLRRDRSTDPKAGSASFWSRPSEEAPPGGLPDPPRKDRGTVLVVYGRQAEGTANRPRSDEVTGFTRCSVLKVRADARIPVQEV